MTYRTSPDEHGLQAEVVYAPEQRTLGMGPEDDKVGDYWVSVDLTDEDAVELARHLIAGTGYVVSKPTDEQWARFAPGPS